MVEDAVWSDGESIDAHDVVFTMQACLDLKLTKNWPYQCYPEILDHVEAVDDYTVKFYFREKPGLATWQFGVAMGAILPEHFWADTVAESYAFIEGLVEPVHPEEVEDCFAELTEEEKEICAPYLEAKEAYDKAFEDARKTLYEADATGAPVFGGFITDKWEPGAFVQRSPNPNYYFKDFETVHYEDGTWMLLDPEGNVVHQLYGEAKGEETLRYTSGPYAPNVIHSIYGSQDAAFLALADGEIDYVLNPLGLARGLREKAEKGVGIQTYVNDDYGMFYLAFNMRKYPMSEYEFRQAFDIIIDKEFVIDKVLAGVVFPMYAAMPPGNAGWYVDVPTPYVGMTREERVKEAVRVLKEAGWTWTKEPYWDADLEDVVPGEGLLMPNGEPMPELTILGPGPAYDPIRATFNQWISEWARELGMPVKSELTGFNAILGPVFIDANFDMYILGWSLGNPAYPDYFDAFWHSKNDTAVTGNFNTPGFNNPEFDALADEFMATTDIARAKELVAEMQLLIADQRPYIMLFYKQVLDLARDNLIFPYTDTLGGIVEAAGFQTDTKPLFK
jgi:ABC-type transport system substrate-binding protein